MFGQTHEVGSAVLKEIDPVLGPGLLAILRSMGHGDELVVADANFPATALARRLERADGVAATRMVRAILSVMPLDDFVPRALFCMAVVDNEEQPTIVREFESIAREAGYTAGIEALERQAFYDRARSAFAIVASGETRLYGNLILKKGVVRPK